MKWQLPEGTKLKWKKVTLAEMCDFCQGKTQAETPERVDLSELGHPGNTTSFEAEVLFFEDGGCITAESKWSGPYSAMTPDTDADPPEFWIGTPVPK